MNKIVLIVIATLFSVSVCNAQTWFEGEATYSYSFTVGGIPIEKTFEFNEYYKDGNRMSRWYHKSVGESINIFNNKEQILYSKSFSDKIETKKVSEQAAIKVVEIDRNIVEINGYKCIKVVVTSKENDGEARFVYWIDESYAIPYLEGRIPEIPKGLLVKSEESLNSPNMSFSFIKELTELTEKEVSDSKFKL